MDRDTVKSILDDYKNGALGQAEALEKLTLLPFEDMDDIKIDHNRALRQGFPEVVFCPGKTTEQIVRAMTELARVSPNVLASRAVPEVYRAVKEVLPEVRYHERARLVVLEREPLPKDPDRFVLVMTAGTGDVPVAEEAAVTAEVMGNRGGGWNSSPVGPGPATAAGERDRRRGGNGRRFGQCGRRPGEQAGHRRADQHRLRGELPRPVGAAGHAEQLRGRRGGREHRQRFWCRAAGGHDQPVEVTG